MMNVLAIDASTDLLSVALSGPFGSVEASLDIGLRHAEGLMGLIDFCVERSGIGRTGIGLVACASGPGSFTGLRIGMSTAKGISAGLGIPWVAVPTLDCLAWGLECFRGAVVPIVDGKKGRVYSAIYFRGLRIGPWLDLPLARLAGLLNTYPDALATGPDAELFRPYAAERGGFEIDRRAGAPAARALAALGEEAYRRDGAAPADAGPLYLRPSEAEETAADGGRDPDR